jgi:arylsulfatase A-like enzyme
MNVVLIVVDSLRAASLEAFGGRGPGTPFLSCLHERTVCFRRAYATECWTLPTHCSMFTGLLPSQHGAHFHTMAYRGAAPTIAEILSRAGFHTELITRNFVFDGTIPGITRGFVKSTRIVSPRKRLDPFSLFLAAAKPRFRRHVRSTGFFHPLQRDSRRFLTDFARALLPADRLALDHLLERMQDHRRSNRRYFLFANLYDVHAPYPPSADSVLRPFVSLHNILENVRFPGVMARLGAHRYLKPGFRISARGRRMLLERYHRAIELMDEKLATFWREASRSGLLDDTLLILTSDHGEAFGEHGLYLHDASVYDTHLHVPLWVHHPRLAPAVLDDVVSTRDLFGLIRSTGLDEGYAGTILDRDRRARRPIAVAQHFHYPYDESFEPRYRRDLAAAILRSQKVIRCGDELAAYDLEIDPGERSAERCDLNGVLTRWRSAAIADDVLAEAGACLRLPLTAAA